MDTNFIDAIRNDFEGLLINNNLANIQRAEFGFITNDCSFVKSVVSTMCMHALDNPDIFNKEQTNNIINIINILSHD